MVRAWDDGRLRRACFQLTVGPGVLAKVEAEVRHLHALRPELPICVSAAARDTAEVGCILGWGVERVTLALDAATPELYREVKGGSFEKRLELLLRAAGLFPGRIGTHLIAGLGETEEQLVRLVQRLTDSQVTVALFAFTPVPGTRLESRRPPALESYRRLQAAHYLITRGLSRAEAMSFDEAGRLTSYGLPWSRVEETLLEGEGSPGRAFRTSGCPDCNRPYYNERPAGPLYNYPRPLTLEEARRAVGEARPCGGAPESGTAFGPGPGTSRGSGGRGRRRVWRLIVEDRPRRGAENMAVDEAILLAHAAGKVPPTLRFYRWEPPAVSLGYFQDYATEVDAAACRRAGIDIVRRPTGGRAVLHDNEVTYSVVVSTELLPGTVVETYRRLASGLVRGLRELGVEAALAPERGPAGPAGRSGGACFEVPSSYEITAGGRKIVGSAQVRRRGVILQHGSIPLELDPVRLAEALGLGAAAAVRIAARAAGLAEVLGGPAPGYSEVCRAISDGLAAVLGVELEPGGLTPEETAAAGELARDKYGCAVWTEKRPPVSDPTQCIA